MKKSSLEEFIIKFIAAHGDRYTYPDQPYLDSHSKIEIVCREHGSFLQTPNKHSHGRGCPKCARRALEDSKRSSFAEFCAKAKEVHEGKYSYPLQKYTAGLTAIKITCGEHGDFFQKPTAHLSGHGCPSCGKVRAASARKSTWQRFVDKARLKHGARYSYPEQKYTDARTPVKILCPDHGEFLQMPNAHLNGRGCQICGSNKRIISTRDTLVSFIRKANVVHSEKYSYPEQPYVNAFGPLTIICPLHGSFRQIPNSHLSGGGCPKCAHVQMSRGEVALADEFKSLGVRTNHRISLSKVSTPVIKKDEKPYKRMELDLYFRDQALAVEFNGLFWHNEDHVGARYHLDKTKACRELGLDLIHIFEDEWTNKQGIVKSIIRARLGDYDNRYYARKTKLVVVDSSVAGKFYDANHIQGKVPCSEHYGLEFNGEIVAMASFGNRGYLFKNNIGIELIRFCTKLNTQVVGGLSKLLSVYRNQTVKTYCDIRLFNGSGYKSVGFIELYTSKPSYFYHNRLKRLSRFQCQKHKLDKLLANFDPKLTETENMRNNGYSRIFDCGTLVLELPPKNSVNTAKQAAG
jgi:ssDNA-binding Zn-finger/Zn-ribbon topoisomerase 1